MTIRYRYLQTGEFYSGVPARDLSEEEFAALDPEAQEAVRLSVSVYQEVATAAAEPAQDPGDEIHGLTERFAPDATPGLLPALPVHEAQEAPEEATPPADDQAQG